MGAEKDYSILVGRLKGNAKHVTKRKVCSTAQAVPSSRLAGGQTWDPRGFQEVGAKSEDLKQGMEVAKRYCDAPSKALCHSEKDFLSPRTGCANKGGMWWEELEVWWKV